MKKYDRRIKTFENYVEGVDDKELFKEFYNNNPLSKTHALYAFIYSEGFKETENGLYKKTMDIEKMHRIKPDTVSDLHGMKLRSSITGQNLGVIWWPKDATELVDDKGTDELEQWVIDTIEKHKSNKPLENSSEIFNDIIDTFKNMDKFDI